MIIISVDFFRFSITIKMCRFDYINYYECMHYDVNGVMLHLLLISNVE